MRPPVLKTTRWQIRDKKWLRVFGYFLMIKGMAMPTMAMSWGVRWVKGVKVRRKGMGAVEMKRMIDNMINVSRSMIYDLRFMKNEKGGFD